MKIKRLKESGILETHIFFNRNHRARYFKEIGKIAEPAVLTMDHLSTGFLIWIIMLFIAVLVFASEFGNYWIPKVCKSLLLYFVLKHYFAKVKNHWMYINNKKQIAISRNFNLWFLSIAVEICFTFLFYWNYLTFNFLLLWWAFDELDDWTFVKNDFFDPSILPPIKVSTSSELDKEDDEVLLAKCGVEIDRVFSKLCLTHLDNREIFGSKLPENKIDENFDKIESTFENSSPDVIFSSKLLIWPCKFSL